MKDRFVNFKITDEDAPLIEKLPAHHRAVLTATGTTVQIAATLNINVGTVKSRLNRARVALAALRAEAMQPEPTSNQAAA